MKAAEFSNAKQLLLERRLQSAKARAKSPSSIPRVPRSPGLPLSFAQQRLWFLDQLIPGSPAYNIWEIVRLTGTLDRAALQWSLKEILNRHESLRTVFEDTDGQPAQNILTETEFRLEITDLRAVPEQEREAELKRLAIAESKKPFDLTRDVMMRAKLFQLTEDEHVLAITMHHIASDAWSLGILFQELARSEERR